MWTSRSVLKENGTQRNQSFTTGTKYRNMKEGNKYWRKEGNRLCRISERNMRTTKHLQLLKDCADLEKVNLCVGKVVRDGREVVRVVQIG